MANSDFYSYMHNIFGYEAMNIFDMKYEPTIRVNEKQKESQDSNNNSEKR